MKEVGAEQLSIFLSFLKMEVVRAIHIDLGDLAVLEEPSPALGAGFGNKVVSSANDEGGWEFPGPPGGGLGDVVEQLGRIEPFHSGVIDGFLQHSRYLL